MSLDIKNYIIRTINAADPDIDTSPSSGVSDILINPLAPILQPYSDEHNTILQNMSLNQPAEMPEKVLDAIGDIYLTSRIYGTKAQGQVYLYFDLPRAITIPQFTIFQTESGLQFETLADFSISRLQMELNTEYPYYVAGPIDVSAVDYGSIYNIDSGLAFSINSRLSFSPLKIINKVAFSSGTDTETNETYFQRIVRTVYGKSLASPAAIKNIITENYPTITEVEVVGAGNQKMIRDIIYNVDDLLSFSREDFTYVRSGEHNPPYNKQHIAYTGVFKDIDTTAEVQFPALADWSQEFSDDDYQGVSSFDDLNYTEQTQKILINTFNENLADPNPSLSLILISGGWNVNDGKATNQLVEPNEIGLDGQSLRLGSIIDFSSSSTSKAVKLPYIELQEQLNILAAARTSGDYSTVDSVLAFLNEYSSTDNVNNLSPIIHKQIDQHTGIQIQCTVKTTDNTELGEMSYITVLRNNVKFSPQDGFGLAWKKQPQYLIRMQENAYTDDALRASDLVLFTEEYGTDLEYEASYYLGKIKDNPTFWKYNVFLVDNDILQEEVWVGHEQMWDQTSGKNQFLQAAKVWIEPNLLYNVVMKIHEYLGFEAWVWNETDSPGFVPGSNNKTLNRGQTYPTYVPQSGEKRIANNGVEQLEYFRNHFGIAVAETKNNEWYYSNLKVWSFLESFPMHLFRFKIDTTRFDTTKALNIVYCGLGFDAEQTALFPDKDNARVKLGVLNFSGAEPTWETVGWHANNIVSGQPLVLNNFLISGEVNVLENYIDENGYLNIAATAANSGKFYDGENVLEYDYTHNLEHTLRSYGIQINNGSAAGIHKGNSTDIYVFDPRNIVTGSVVAQVAGSQIQTRGLLGIQGYIQEIVEIKEYISQVSYDPETYIITSTDKGLTYSANPNYKISFNVDNLDGTLVEIVYKYWSAGATLNTLLLSDEVRFPSADYMLKTMPPVVVVVKDLEYSGTLSEADVKIKLKEWINNLGNVRLDKSDIVAYLYDLGADYVNLDIDISFRIYTTEGDLSLVDFTEQSYSLSTLEISRFFTDIENLYGVTKL